MWNERIQHDTTQNMWSWFDVILNHLIWYGTKWNVVICYGAKWNVVGHNVHTTCLINMKSTKSAYVMSFCMLRRCYMNGTVCACHIMKLFIPGASPNWPDWQAYVKIWANMTMRAQSNNQTCGVLKTWLARKKLHKLRTRHTNWHMCFFLMLILLMPYIVALFQPHSSWWFFSGWVVANNIRTDPYPRLEKHADDGHHCKSSVGDFGIELFGFLSRVRSGQHLESKVSGIRSTSWGLFLGDLAECHVGQDLTPSSMVGILSLWTTHINQQSNISYLVY